MSSSTTPPPNICRHSGRPVSYVHDTWAPTKPPGTQPEATKISASPPSPMFLSDLPPVLSNYFRPGCNQPVFSSQEHPSSTTSASCVHASPIARTRLSPIMPLSYHAFFLKLYESAFRMDGKKERIKRIDDANFGPVRKTLEWWPCLSATLVVASEGWWWKEVWKKGLVGFTVCPSSKMGSCWRASPEGDAHRDFTRAGRGWYLASGQ